MPVAMVPKKGAKPGGKLKASTNENMIPGISSKIQVPKIKLNERKPQQGADRQGLKDQKKDAASAQEEKPASEVSDDHPDIQNDKYSSPAADVKTADITPPTPEPLLILAPVQPQSSTRRPRRKTGIHAIVSASASKSSKSAEEPPTKSAKKRHAAATTISLATKFPAKLTGALEQISDERPAADRASLLKDGDDVFRYMQDLAKEAEQLLPQEDEQRPRRKRKAKEEQKGTLLEQLKESWGGAQTYLERLELAAKDEETACKEAPTGNDKSEQPAGANNVAACNLAADLKQSEAVIDNSPLGGVISASAVSSSPLSQESPAPAFSFAANFLSERITTPSLDLKGKPRASTASLQPTPKPLIDPPPSCKLTAVANEHMLKLQAAAMAAAMELSHTAFVHGASGSPAPDTTKPAKADKPLPKKSMADHATKGPRTASKTSRISAGFGSSTSRGLSSAVERVKKGIPASSTSKETSIELDKGAAPSARLKSSKENVVPKTDAEELGRPRTSRTLAKPTQLATRRESSITRRNTGENQQRDAQEQLRKELEEVKKKLSISEKQRLALEKDKQQLVKKLDATEKQKQSLAKQLEGVKRSILLA